MKDEFEMYGGGIKPAKSTGTCWIDHRMREPEHVTKTMYVEELRKDVL